MWVLGTACSCLDIFQVTGGRRVSTQPLRVVENFSEITKRRGSELAGGIEPATRGLGISSTATADNLTPQETTKQDTHEVGAEGAGLSCPGTSVVADSGNDVELDHEGKYQPKTEPQT